MKLYDRTSLTQEKKQSRLCGYINGYFQVHPIYVLWGHSVCLTVVHIKEVLKKWMNTLETFFCVHSRESFVLCNLCFSNIEMFTKQQEMKCWWVPSSRTSNRCLEFLFLSPVGHVLGIWTLGSCYYYKVTIIKSHLTFGCHISSSLCDLTSHLTELCIP